MSGIANVYLSERDKELLQSLLKVCVNYDVLDLPWAPQGDWYLFDDSWEALKVIERITKPLPPLLP
ncbi:hypothetical protein [Caudoviricetes sp.]|nr:hypothetical protein [Caudoviricetes sp.]